MTTRLLFHFPALIFYLFVTPAFGDIYLSTVNGPHQRRLRAENLTEAVVLFNQQSSGQVGNLVTGHLNGQSPGLVDVQGAANVILSAGGGQSPQVTNNAGGNLFELTITPNPSNQASESLFHAISFTVMNANSPSDVLNYELTAVAQDGSQTTITQTVESRPGNDFFGALFTGPLLAAVKVTSNSLGFRSLRHLQVSFGATTITPNPLLVPEPLSLVGWLLVAGALTFVIRRRRVVSVFG